MTVEAGSGAGVEPLVMSGTRGLERGTEVHTKMLDDADDTSTKMLDDTDDKRSKALQHYWREAANRTHYLLETTSN